MKDQLSASRLALLQQAVDGLTVEKLQGLGFEDGATILDWATKRALLFPNIDFIRMVATGFNRSGAEAIKSFAQEIRSESSFRKRAVKLRTLETIVARQLVSTFRDRDNRIALNDVKAVQTALDDWFARFNRTYRHFVPCVLTSIRAPKFTIGPVSFTHIDDFEVCGVSFESAPEKFREGLATNYEVSKKSFEDAIRERNGDWIAEVAVFGREDAQSVFIADSAVDVGLGAFQCAVDNEEFYGAHRVTDRGAPGLRVDFWMMPDGFPLFGLHNRTPGRAVDETLFVKWLADFRAPLDSMGRRIAGYLFGDSATPNLDTAWCNAAYWYHQALAETLDTVRITKLETAMEVLFGAESARQSNSRLTSALEVFLGLKPEDKVGASTSMTSKQLVASIVTTRSRVLHGTWPTLTSDAPPIGFADVNYLCRNLLLDSALAIDRYAEVGSGLDESEDFLAWVKSNRT